MWGAHTLSRVIKVDGRSKAMQNPTWRKRKRERVIEDRMWQPSHLLYPSTPCFILIISVFCYPCFAGIVVCVLNVEDGLVFSFEIFRSVLIGFAWLFNFLGSLICFVGLCRAGCCVKLLYCVVCLVVFYRKHSYDIL